MVQHINLNIEPFKGYYTFPESPVLPIFSNKAEEIFAQLGSEIAPLKTDLWNDVHNIKSHLNLLQIEKDNERGNKILQCLGVAFCITLIVAGIIGTGLIAGLATPALLPLIGIPLIPGVLVGTLSLPLVIMECQRTFKRVPNLEQQIEKMKTENHLSQHVEAYKSFLQTDYDTLREQIENEIAIRRASLIDGGELETLKQILTSLDELHAFYCKNQSF